MRHMLAHPCLRSAARAVRCLSGFVCCNSNLDTISAAAVRVQGFLTAVKQEVSQKNAASKWAPDYALLYSEARFPVPPACIP